MLLDSAACRAAVSAASDAALSGHATAGWRCRPSRVLLRSGSLPVAANARTIRRGPAPALSTGGPVVHRSPARGPGRRPGSDRSRGDRHPCRPPRRPARHPRAGPCTAPASERRRRGHRADDATASRDVLPPARPRARRRGRRRCGPARPGWPTTCRSTAPELAHGAVLGLGRPGARRPAAGGRARWNCTSSAAPTRAGRCRSGRARHVLGPGQRGRRPARRPGRVPPARRRRGGPAGRSRSPTSGRPTAAALDDARARRAARDLADRRGPAPGRQRAHRHRPGRRAGRRGRPRRRADARCARCRAMTRARSPRARSSSPRPPAEPPRRRAGLGRGRAARRSAACSWRWLLHTPTFLFFALLSPVVALGTWLSERWSGRRSRPAGRRGARRRGRWPPRPARRGRRAPTCGRPRPPHPDLAALVARRPAALAPAVEPARGRRGRAHRPGGQRPGRHPRDAGAAATDPGSACRPPHLPVTVDLRTGGGLAVVGPRERALGVLAAVLAQLATLHAPGEVDLLLLTDPARLRDWAWARWLPHLPPDAVHVAATRRPTGRSGRRA